MMSLELFSKIIDQAAPLTEQVCLHLMGEPLLHPNLKAFFDLCHLYGLPIFFVTNGILLKQQLFPLLLHPALRQINFSLHSFPDVYPEKDPKHYLDTIFKYTELAFFERPELYINYRLWDLKAIRGVRKENLTTLRAIEERFQISVPTHHDVGLHKSHKLKNRLYMHFDTEFTWPSMELASLGTTGTCYGLKSHFGILVDGTVVPCCLDKEGVIALGNVNDSALVDILSSQRAQNMALGFQEHRLVEEMCQRCPYIERFSRSNQSQKYLENRLTK